jgi:branched-chain amino acid aminotransferase
MGFFASVNGNVTPADEARVSVLDNGFTFGDAVYETLRTYGGRPFALDRHLRRLRRSAERIGIALPQKDVVLAAWLDALLSRAANPESYIRFIVSRGVGDISYRFERVQGPTVVMAVKPFEPLPAAQFEEGIPVVIASVRRNAPDALDPAIKSCNLLNNILAVREAQARGCDEPLLLNQDGFLAEGASTNLFIVWEGALMTPPLSAGILAGITREVVLELAASLGTPCHQKPLHLDALLGADEAFMTSTTREIVPVHQVDDALIGDGRPGPYTCQLMDAFHAYAPSHCGQAALTAAAIPSARTSG